MESGPPCPNPTTHAPRVILMKPPSKLAAAAVLALLASPALAQFELPAAPADRAAGRSAGTTHEVQRCVIGLVSRIDLAAPEAGILTHVTVRRGSRFKGEELLARIDSREAEVAYKRAGHELKLAQKRAKDDIEWRYAEAQKLVERADWEEVMQANLEVKGAVTEAEIRREKLEYDRAVLGSEKAIKDQELVELEVLVKRAEMEAAVIAIEKRQVLAPFDGEVLRMHREQGEWVQPGEVIAEIAQLDTLQIDGWVYFSQYDPREVENCRVTVDVRVGPNRVEQATGYVVYVDPVAVMEAEPKYLVRAEISNRLEDGRWLISPNLPATMKIHLDTKGEALSKRPSHGRDAK
ncbi:multidrug resistance protein MdtN [Planctomycetes bacterium MalM25]|nr:multidrug resistance protein MdtN [Planctomycetes bacterium MalM25]